jgi:hypothetical protein
MLAGDGERDWSIGDEGDEDWNPRPREKEREEGNKKCRKKLYLNYIHVLNSASDF